MYIFGYLLHSSQSCYIMRLNSCSCLCPIKCLDKRIKFKLTDEDETKKQTNKSVGIDGKVDDT